ncbi:alkaline phosphatase D family protein [Actinoplanes sp. NPDC089786]|uniref:alkaline phosphatase D family protein n=1 Tax=Actinoplanes sp. NPDC089786 TaxID=3155185 RepID=UPI003418AFF9
MSVQGVEISPVGRTRTAPADNARPQNLRFAFASCQDYQAGFYTAYAHLAEEDLGFVAFLGDYIYEGAPNPNARRVHEGAGEPLDLAQYRNRHAQYKTDPHLQAAHAAFPWIVTFDDHEIDNNWADEIPQDPQLQTPSQFRARRIAAFQAYYEHMPLRAEQAQIRTAAEFVVENGRPGIASVTAEPVPLARTRTAGPIRAS